MGLESVHKDGSGSSVEALVGSSGRDPAQYALHSARIRGATQLAARGIPELQIQWAGRWKSGAFMTYVRAAGEGAQSVSAALASKELTDSGCPYCARVILPRKGSSGA